MRATHRLTKAALLVLLGGCSGVERSAAPDAPEIRFEVIAAPQSGPAGEELSQPIVVRVSDAWGPRTAPRAGQVVNWVVTSGGGSVWVGATETDRRGESRNYWKLGPQVGAQTLEARAVDPTSGERLVFGTVTVSATAPRRFHFEQEFDGARAAAGVPYAFRDHLKVALVDQYGVRLQYVNYWVTSAAGGCTWTESLITCPTPGSFDVQFQQDGYDGVENPAFRPRITLQVD